MSYHSTIGTHNLIVSVSENQTIQELIKSLETIAFKKEWTPVTRIQQVSDSKVRIHLDTASSYNYKDFPDFNKVQNLDGIIYMVGEDGQHEIKVYGSYVMDTDLEIPIEYYYTENTEITKLEQQQKQEQIFLNENTTLFATPETSQFDKPVSTEQCAITQFINAHSKPSSNSNGASILESIRRSSNQRIKQELEALLSTRPTASLFEAYQSYFNIENREPNTIPPEHKQCIIAEIDEELKSIHERQSWLESMKSSLG